MGNEASLEGGEGALAGLPEGLVPDGKGGFVQMPAGTKADLSHLSEEDRKQLSAAMARSQTSRSSESQQSGGGATRGPSGLSKSRTVDAFGEGPSTKPKPGRSPSSLSLLESRFRQEPKDPEQPRTGMFSSGFLSGANPLSAVSSAVSSASIPKFSLFGDEEEEQADKQGEKTSGPQAGPGKGPQQQAARPPPQGQPKGQGPPQQKGGVPPQGPGGRPAGAGPQQQGAKPGGPGPQQAGPKPGGPGPQQAGPKPGGPGPQQAGPKPGGPGPQQAGPKPGGPGPQQAGLKPGGPGPQQAGLKPEGPGPQQAGPKPGGPGPQQAGLKPGGPGPQQAGPKAGDPGSQQQGPRKAGSGGPGKPGGPQEGPAKDSPQQGGPGKPGPQQKGPPGQGVQVPGPGKPGPAPEKGGLCPLCKTAELNVHAKDQPPNFSTCTQCKQQVCNLCGFSPPDSAGKEWLCLNCQMQRAMGGMEPPGPPMMKQPPKQGSAPPSPQRKDPAKAGPAPKTEPGKKPPLLTKQQSITDAMKGPTPPTTPKQKSPGPGPPGSPKGPQPGAPGAKPGQPPPLQKPGVGGPPKIDPKTGRPIQEPGKAPPSPKGSPVPSPAKAKQESSFFSGFGLGGLTDVAKQPQASESVTGKLFGGFGGSSKPQGGAAAPQGSESVTGKLFSGFGGLTETPKPSVTASPSAEGVSGKMFGFGSSFLSSASNLISSTVEGDDQESPPESPPGSPPDSPIDSDADSPPGSPPDSESPPDTPPAHSKEPTSPKPVETEAKPLAGKSALESTKAEEPTTQAQRSDAQSSCPLCKFELNMGSGDAPNFSTCTECKRTVCNQCGFNPMPHLSENEWLCLNCQTQRALSGQLGDMTAPPSPSKLPAKLQPTPPSSPAHKTTSTPASPAPTATASPAKQLSRMPSLTQAPAERPEPDSVKADDKKSIAETKADAAEKEENNKAALAPVSTQVELNEAQTPDTTSENTEAASAPPEQIVEAATLPPVSVPGQTADVKDAEKEQAETEKPPPPRSEEQNAEAVQPEQTQSVEIKSASEVSPVAEGESKNVNDEPRSESTAQIPTEVSIANKQDEIASEEAPEAQSIQETETTQEEKAGTQDITAENKASTCGIDDQTDKQSSNEVLEEVSTLEPEHTQSSTTESENAAMSVDLEKASKENVDCVVLVSVEEGQTQETVINTTQGECVKPDQPALSESPVNFKSEEIIPEKGSEFTLETEVQSVTSTQTSLPQDISEQEVSEEEKSVAKETEAELQVATAEQTPEQNPSVDLTQAEKMTDGGKVVEEGNMSVEREERKPITEDTKVEHVPSHENNESLKTTQETITSTTECSDSSSTPVQVHDKLTEPEEKIPEEKSVPDATESTISKITENTLPQTADISNVPAEAVEDSAPVFNEKTEQEQHKETQFSPPQTQAIESPVPPSRTISDTEVDRSKETKKLPENHTDTVLTDNLPQQTVSAASVDNETDVPEKINDEEVQKQVEKLNSVSENKMDKSSEPPPPAQEKISVERDIKEKGLDTEVKQECDSSQDPDISSQVISGEKDTFKLDKETEAKDPIPVEDQMSQKTEQITRVPAVSEAKTLEKVSEDAIINPDLTVPVNPESDSDVKTVDPSPVINDHEVPVKTAELLSIDSESEKSQERSTLPSDQDLSVIKQAETTSQGSSFKPAPACSEVITDKDQERKILPTTESEPCKKPDIDSSAQSVPHSSVPVEEPPSPPSVVSKQDKDVISNEEKSPTETEEKKDDESRFIPTQVDELGEKKTDSVTHTKEKKLLKEPVEMSAATQESSPTSPSDLAKLESTVLQIIEAQTTTETRDSSQKVSEPGKSRRKLEVLPMSPDFSSEEDGHGEAQEQDVPVKPGSPKKERKKLLVPEELQGDSLEDSSEGEPSPLLQRKQCVSGEKNIRGRSAGTIDEEELIRKQIIEMSADEDMSPSDEESLVRKNIRDQQKKTVEQDTRKDSTEKSESGRARRLLKKSSISPEDERDCKSIVSVVKTEEPGKGEHRSLDSRADIRHFKTIELNSTATVRQTSDDGELESLTDSPDDRSRGEGSSSLHASSFTPGTSPTSLSSLDEDSDSSSPSYIRSSSEGKQHRKAKHRQPGQMLPTIEDSSEEEELREEEELLKEQEKQKSSGKKSKKDKDEIRAQRRREHAKTPPSNLSPIEDASPTEELRQEAEMEEFRRSSCSDFSPSMESEPEGIEILPEKIAAVQKVYQLPTSVSLYSPTDEQHADKDTKEKRPLKSADEAYEEILLRAKSPNADKVEALPGKDSLYSGMLIEDYAYESLVEDAQRELEKDQITIPEKPKKLRSPDEVYEDMMHKRMMLLQQEIKEVDVAKEIPKPETVLPSAISSGDTASKITTPQLSKDGKPLLDAEEAYEELMKRQKAVLTPGTSPTQTDHQSAEGIPEAPSDQLEVVSPKRVLPIPDLRVTQCSSGEEESGEESIIEQKHESDKTTVSEPTPPTPVETKSTAVVSDIPEQTPSAPPVSEPLLESAASKQEIIQEPPQTDLSEPATEAILQPMEVDQPGVVDLSRSSGSSQTGSVPAPIPTTDTKTSPPVVVSVSPLPTVPQYTAMVQSVVSTAPPIPPKPAVLRRGVSQEKTDIPAPPPLPPPTLPKPSLYPKKTPPQVPPRTSPVGGSVTVPSAPVRQPLAPVCKPHVPPPVPPKPSSIPAGLTFSHRPGESIKPPIAPKPMAAAPTSSPAQVVSRPTILPTTTTDVALNLSPSAESKPLPTSPLRSPTSPRLGKSLHETYVVITLPSQPSSPVEGITTQASISPGSASPTKQAPPQSQQQGQLPPEPQPQTTRVPLAFTRITESIESQEICGPEKVVSSMSHVYEAISATTQQPSVIPNVVAQVVTTEVQRTTVSVVHERTPPPLPTPRATGITVVPEKTQSLPQTQQSGQVYHPGEVVDLRTPKMDVETSLKGVDLSSSESRRQSLPADGSGRPTSAVQSSVINLSTDTSSMSVVTDSITILTCTATIAYGNSDVSQVTSMPLQLTTAKSFEPVSQIIYRPVDSQPEKPINLSTTVGKGHPAPVTIAPTSITNGVSSSVPPRLEIGLSGAVDLTTTKPVQTIVSVDGSTSEVITAVITEDDSKPVDLTAGRRTVCCDVVYKLPFAGSCATQQPPAPLPEDRFGYRDDHYQYDRSPYSMRGFGGIKPSMSDTNLAEAGLFFYKSKNSYDYNGAAEGAVDLTSGKMSETGEAVDYSSKATGSYSGMTIPQYTQARITSAVGTHFGVSSVLRSSNGVVYSSVAAPVPSTYAITTQPGSIFSTTYNTLSGMHTSDTMPSLSSLQSKPLTRSHSFLSTIAVTTAEDHGDVPLNLETGVSKDVSTVLSEAAAAVTTVSALDTYTDASLEAIAASLEALSSPMVPGDPQYQMERELLELEKMKQQRLAEELEWERQEIQRFREQEQLLVQKELEELQAMKQQILCQQEEERQAHLMMQKETYAQQQEQLEQIQRLQEQLRQQLEEQKFRQMYSVETQDQAQTEPLAGLDKKMDSGVQTDEEDNTMDKAYTAGRKKRSVRKSVDSSVQTDDEDQDEWEVPTRGRRSRARDSKYSVGERVSVQALTEISVQTDSSGTLRGHSVQMDTKVEYPDSDGTSSPQRDKRRPTPLDIGHSPHLKADSSTLQVAPAPPKSPKVLYSPISPCVSPSKSLEFVSYEKSLGDTSPQRIRAAAEPSKGPPPSPRGPKVIQRSMSDPKPMSPTSEERAATTFQYSEGYTGKGSPGGTPSGTQKKVKRTLPNPPSEEEAAIAGQTAYSTGSARRRLCRSTNMARAKILQDIDRELDLVERESSKLRKKQAELDEEEKEIDAKLRYLEMGINRRKEALLKEREKRERAYLQSVAEDRDYMSDSEVSNIRETRRGGGGEEMSGHGLERPRTAPQSELDQFVPPQTKHDVQYGKYSQYQYPQQTLYQQSLYQSQQPYQSQSIYSSVPSLTASQQQSYHQMLLLQQKARQQAALLSELDATKMAANYDVIRSQPDASTYLGGKYGSHLDLRGIEERGGSIAGSPMSNVSADSFYTEVDHHHQTPRSYLLLEEAAELAKGTAGLSSTSYGIAEKELAKAERLLRRTAADVGTDYLGSSSRLHSYTKTQDDEDPMEEPYELKLLKQQLKQEFRRSTGGTESLEQLAGLSHHYYTPSTALSSAAYRPFPKTEKYSISRLTLEKQAAKQLPTSMLYQKHKTTSNIGKFSSSIQEGRAVETDYTSYLSSSGGSPRSSRLLQDEITFGLRKNIAEQQKYLGSTLGANLAGSLNFGQNLNLTPGMRSSLGEDSVYPSGSRSRPSSRPSSVYGLDLSLKRDTSSSSLRLKAEGEPSSETSAYQTPSGRTKPTSLPICQSGRGRIPIVAQNSEEESPLSPVGQPMGMARASAGPLPPISADSRDQFGSCLSLQDPQQQHPREDPTRGRGYIPMDDLQATMSDSEAYHLQQEETDWFDKPHDGQTESGQSHDRRQAKSTHYPFPHMRVKLQRDPKDHSVTGNGLGIRVVGGKEIPGSNGEIGAYVAKVLPGGAAEQTGKIVEGMQVLEWNNISLNGKTYEEVQGLVSQQSGEAELCVRLDLNMLSDSESSHLNLHEQVKAGDGPPRSPGVDPKQLAAELQKVSQQQAPASSSSSLTAADKGPHTGTASAASSAIPSPGQPGSPSVSKKRHSKTSDVKTQSHPVTGEIQLQINYDKQLGNLIVHVLQARNLAPRDNNGYSDPFVKVYLLPGRGQVMVVQNASAENKRRSKHAQKSLNPEWNQTVIYKNIHLEQLRKKTLEVSVWDYDKCSSNDFLGEVLVDLSNTAQLDNVPRWLPLKEQSESEHHRRSHSSRQHSPKPPSHSNQQSPKTSAHGNQDSPKSSVIKSRSHGIFPDPGKDTQVPTIEKSHSSPGTSKPSPSDGQARSHGTPRSHSKSAATRARLEDDGAGTGSAEAVAQQHRLQPTQNSRLSLRHHRHSVVGVLTVQKPLSDSSANEIRDGRHATLRKAMSEERPHPDGASRGHRSGDGPVTAASLDSGLSGSAYSLLEEEEGGTNAVDSAIFQVPKLGKIPNGTDVLKSSPVYGDTEGKTQVMGEIKIALKKEMKTEGEHLVLEILQCRNITYKFKSPDHLPDLYVKLYVVNVATQKRIIKKKTRVCRHDREPSFNETFRFCMNPTGHSIQLFLVSNGGKFVKKTLIGEAYIWLDKVDLRKRVVSWHKLLATTAQIHS